MRLLAINPNTTDAVTEKLLEAGRTIAPPGLEIIGASGRFGARYISTRSAAAIAGHAALDAFAPHAGKVDGVLLACFGDPGLLALRELADCPVLGLAEAACREAAHDGRRFSIITGGKLWPPMLEELLVSLGLAASLASIRAVAPTAARSRPTPPPLTMCWRTPHCRPCARMARKRSSWAARVSWGLPPRSVAAFPRL